MQQFQVLKIFFCIAWVTAGQSVAGNQALQAIIATKSYTGTSSFSSAKDPFPHPIDDAPLADRFFNQLPIIGNQYPANYPAETFLVPRNIQAIEVENKSIDPKSNADEAK